jgi:hypothetical protein
MITINTNQMRAAQDAPSKSHRIAPKTQRLSVTNSIGSKDCQLLIKDNSNDSPHRDQGGARARATKTRPVLSKVTGHVHMCGK